MPHRFKRFIMGTVASLVLLALPLVAATPAAALTDIQRCIAQGTNLNATGLGASCNGNTDTSSSALKIDNLLHTVINIFSLIVGIAAVIMIIIGGFRYITSGGESSNVSGAKNTIIYAIIGLVIMALAQFIVQFVVNKITLSS